MMSDPKLRGKVIWLLMTARIHLLSPDIVAQVEWVTFSFRCSTPRVKTDWTSSSGCSKPAGEIGAGLVDWLDKEGLPPRLFRRWLLSPTQSNQSPAAQERRRAESHRTRLYSASHRTDAALSNAASFGQLHATQSAADPNVSDAERAQWEKEISHLELQGIK